MDSSGTLDELSRTFLALHERKEDLFWTTRMGLASDRERVRREHAEAELAFQRFVQDPSRLDALRSLRRSIGDPGERRVLDGWVSLFEANVVETAEGRALAAEIVERESQLAEDRAGMALGYVDPVSGAHVPASSVKLSLMQRTDPDPARRRAAYEGLRTVERFVLDHGFVDILKKRNRLARLLGHEDFYAYQLARTERMTKARLFGLLDDLVERLAPARDRTLRKLEERFGERIRAPYELPFLRAGALTAELDPYFGFAPSLGRWGRAFHALGVRYRGATMTLDLVDRSGKYENGFMHGPGLAFSERGRFRPARINFTANAVPGAPGSGLRATETLFHEGGHAAHFANIVADAPCFSQEFAPTSVAYAETQSMFMDAMLGDPAFRARYATDASGVPMPRDLLEHAIMEEQPHRAFDVLALVTIPLAERALYELPDDELTPDRVLEVLRGVERHVQGLDAGVRPVLAVPHLLESTSSAYYHAYVLADMALRSTWHHFLARDGHVTDNPRVGPELAAHYWAPGNAREFEDTLASLLGHGLTPHALVEWATRSSDDAVAEARRALSTMESVPRVEGPVELDATIRIVHGHEVVGTTELGSFEEVADAFARFIERLESGGDTLAASDLSS